MTDPLPSRQSTTASYEEATRCPKCEMPGRVRSKQPVLGRPKGTQLHLVYCENDRCTWYDTSWPVQVNPDGTVPVFERAADHLDPREKVYPKQTNTDEATDRVVRALERQVELELGGRNNTAEIRNPYTGGF
jgi:hypothetical protein